MIDLAVPPIFRAPVFRAPVSRVWRKVAAALRAIALILLGASWTVAASEAQSNETPSDKAQPRKQISVPNDVGMDHLKARSEAQHATLDEFDVFYFFRFNDATAESGIRFRHLIVDDAGRDYKMVHYDHGNGIAVADVDGDGLHDIYFMTQVGANELWRNLGRGKFENVTEAAGVALDDRISVTGSFADVDNDGDPDLFVTTVKMGNVLFLNDGQGRFQDISKAAGVDYVGHSSGAVFFDYDRDGWLDLFVTNVGTYTTDEQGRADYYVGVDRAFSGHLFEDRTEASILYRNLRGDGGAVRFADVSKTAGLVDTSWSGDATAVDLNRDGWLDLYVLNMQGDDSFYLNVEGRFQDASEDFFPVTPWGTMGAEFLDYNNDGLLDLALSDMHSDMSETIGPEREKLKSRMQWKEPHLQGGDNNVFGNAFYRNLGKIDDQWRLEETSDALGTENYWPWGLSAGDLNADGFEDLFITSSMNYPFRYGVNSLLLNNRGQAFLDSEFILGVEPRVAGVTREWFDLECGAEGQDKDHAHCEGQDGPITVLGTLGTRASVLFDLDRDGDLDIVTNEFNAEPLVLVSDLSTQTQVRSLEIELIGKDSNRDGLGAVVTVVAGEQKLTQSHDGKSGYLSQSSLPLYFGLGDRQKVDRVVVEWPSGNRQEVSEGIRVGSLLTITEASAGD